MSIATRLNNAGPPVTIQPSTPHEKQHAAHLAGVVKWAGEQLALAETVGRNTEMIRSLLFFACRSPDASIRDMAQEAI